METGLGQICRNTAFRFFSHQKVYLPLLQNPKTLAKQNFQGSFKTGINFPHIFTECFAKRRRKEFNELKSIPQTNFQREGEGGKEYLQMQAKHQNRNKAKGRVKKKLTAPPDGDVSTHLQILVEPLLAGF